MTIIPDNFADTLDGVWHGTRRGHPMLVALGAGLGRLYGDPGREPGAVPEEIATLLARLADAERRA